MASCSCFCRHQNVYLYIPNIIGERPAPCSSGSTLTGRLTCSRSIPSDIMCRLRPLPDPGGSGFCLQPTRAVCGNIFLSVSDLQRLLPRSLSICSKCDPAPVWRWCFGISNLSAWCAGLFCWGPCSHQTISSTTRPCCQCSTMQICV